MSGGAGRRGRVRGKGDPGFIIKRVYDPPAATDGTRILVDRLWPRGLSKVTARIDHWARDVSPSTAARQWYHAHPGQWGEFQRRYFAELDANPDAVASLRALLAGGPSTLLFGSRELERNNATALAEYLSQHPAATRRRPRER